MAAPNRQLEAARMNKRWSVAAASERVGVSINTFNRWERGLQVPQLGTLDSLCKTFELSPAELGFERAVTPRRRSQDPYQEPASPDSGSAIHSPTAFTLPVISAGGAAPPGATQRDDVGICLEQVKRSLESMNQVQDKHNGEEHNGVSPRHAIAALLGAPAAILGLARNSSTYLLHPEEVLSLCAVSIPMSWQLYFEGGLIEAERVLPGYLLQLHTLAAQKSPYQGRAASLLSQGCQLASLLALQHQNFGSAQLYARQAFEYGELADDPNLQTTSLVRQAQVYLYLHRPAQKLVTYERMLPYIHRITPLLQGRVYIGLAEAHSHLHHEREAQNYLSLSYKTFPEQYNADPNFVYTHFNRWSLASFEALMYLHLKQPGQAWNLFQQVSKFVPVAAVPNRVELTVRQAQTAHDLNDMEQSCKYVAAAMQAAISAGNQLRCNEAYSVYDGMRTKWSKEHNVKALAKLFL